MADTQLLIAILSLVTSILSPIALYFAFKKGAEETIDIAIKKVEEKTKTSPTAQRVADLLAATDKIFGDDQLVQSITRFFKEAGDLVSSPEAKNFFKNTTQLLKEFTKNNKQKQKQMPPPSNS